MADVRVLTIDNINEAWQLSKGEGWNQTLKDWRFIIEHSGSICLALYAEERIIGTAVALNYNSEVAWIGMVLIHPECRGRGYSKKLLYQIFDRLGDRVVIKLDATPAGVPVYKKLGFKDEYRIDRLLATPVSLPSIRESGILAKNATWSHREAMAQFDADTFGTSRTGLMEYLLREYPQKGWIMKENSSMDGFALGREGTQFHQIGPLMANHPDVAEAILAQSLQNLEGNPVVADVPEDKPELVRLLGRYGFRIQRSYRRMFLHENYLKGNLRNYYLMAGAEFG